MKKSKIKFLTLTLFLTMLLISAFKNVYAEAPLTITITGAGQGHTYEAYQVFKGVLDDDKEGILSNVSWGDGINNANFVQLLKASNKTVLERKLSDDGVNVEQTSTEKTIGEIFQNVKTARDVAEILDLYLDDSDMTRYLAEIINKSISSTKKESTYNSDRFTYSIEVEESGYYFIKDKDGSIKDKNEVYTRYILQVIKDQRITVKGSVPTVEKKVTNTELKKDEINNKGFNSEDSKKVLSAEIGDILEFTLEGTLPTTYDDYKSYKYVFHDTLSKGLSYVENTAKIYILNNEEKTELPVSNMEINYDKENNNTLTFTINDIKQIGLVNKNSKVIIKYMAELTSLANIGSEGNKNKVYLEFSNNPNEDGTGMTNSTPEDEVTVYTYQFDVKKLNGKTNKTLEKVGFKLYKKENESNLYATVDDGIISGWTGDLSKATELFTDSDGHISIKGLQAGTYYLKETTVLNGYNSINDITITITEVLNGNGLNEHTQSLESLSLTVEVIENEKEITDQKEGIVETGIVEATILNYPGSLLPSSGGIGVAVFYILGSILLICSFIFLIKKIYVMK